MSDGFRALMPAQALLIRQFTALALPVNFTTGYLEQYGSIKLAIIYNGGVAPTTAPDFARFQLLWRAASGDLVDVDTFEVNSSSTPGFTSAHAAFIEVPVKGSWCQVVSNAGSLSPPSPRCDIRIYASYQRVSRSRFWQDGANFDSSDLRVLSVVGGSLGPGVASSIYTGGLASGPWSLSGSVAFATGGASVGIARLRFGYGSTGVGPPDVVVTQTNPGNGLGHPFQVTGLFLPRRPIFCFMQNIAGAGANAINSYNFVIIRDEP